MIFSQTILCYNTCMEEIEKFMTKKRVHKKQILWQIWVPLLSAILIVLFLSIMTVLVTTRDISGDFNTKWASVSVVYLSLPVLVTAFLFLVILGLFIYLISKAIQFTPVYGQKAFEFLQIVRKVTLDWSDKAANPVIGFKSKWSGFTRILRKK